MVRFDPAGVLGYVLFPGVARGVCGGHFGGSSSIQSTPKSGNLGYLLLCEVVRGVYLMLVILISDLPGQPRGLGGIFGVPAVHKVLQGAGIRGRITYVKLTLWVHLML